MAAIVDKLASNEAGPFAPGGTITFELPPGEGWADMVRSRIELNVLPSSTATVYQPDERFALTTPAGGWGFVKNIQVETMAGMPLERIEDAAVIAYALQQHGYGTDAEAYREMAYKENRRDSQDWLTVLLAGAAMSYYKTNRVFLDLGLLGIGKYETWPLVATGGLRLKITLNSAMAAFKPSEFNGATVACDNVADPNPADFTQVITTARCYPMVDHERAATELRFRVGDWMVLDRTQGGARTASLVRITAVAPTADGRMTITFGGGPAGGTGNMTNVVVYRATGPDPDAAAPAAPYDPEDFCVFDATDPCAHVDIKQYGTPENDHPFYLGMPLTLITQAGGAGAFGSQTRIITAIATQGAAPNTFIRLTFDAALTAGADRVGFVRGYSPTGLSYSITDPRFRLRRVQPPQNVAEQFKSGLNLDLLTVANFPIQTGTAPTRIDATLPAPDYLTRALAILCVPTITGGTSFDQATRGQRSTYSDFQWWVDGESDPAQAIDVQRSRPPVWDVQMMRALDNLSKASDGILAPLKVLPPGRLEWCFPKALNAAGMSRDIGSKVVRLVVSYSAATANEALTLHNFVFHYRQLKLSPQGVQLL